MMRGFVLVILLHSASAAIHSLKYFHTVSSGLTNLPEYVVVGQLDGVEMVRYDSNTRTMQPTQDWIYKVTDNDPQFWDKQTQKSMANQQVTKVSIERARQRLNKTIGVHMLQTMFGCEWDDETGETTDGWLQYAYDGEDFISFDLKTQTWTASKQQALTTKLRWDVDGAMIAQKRNYLSTVCPEWGKMYLNYGSSSLLTTEVPSVFLLQRSPWSPISCMATGFFPDRAMLFWTKDGEELHEGVHIGESLPNHDGTFQTSADLDPPPHEDWHSYQCVFQLSGLKEKLITTLDKAAVRTNSDKGGIIPIVLGVVAVVLLLGAGLTAFFIYRKKQEDEKVASDPAPHAGVPSEEKKWSSSSGTVMKPPGSGSDSDSAIGIPDECESPTPDTKAPLIERSLSSLGSSTSDKDLTAGTCSRDSIDSVRSQGSDTPLLKRT